MVDVQEERQREALVRAMRAPGVGYGGLWFAYRGLGGTSSRLEIEAHLNGRLSLPPLQGGLLAEAATELLEAFRPLPRAASGDGAPPQSPAGASAASAE